jgi:hypothetical protein
MYSYAMNFVLELAKKDLALIPPVHVQPKQELPIRLPSCYTVES